MQQIKALLMKKQLIIICSFYLVLLASCGGAPEIYNKAEQLYVAEKYDSSMYYFDRLLPEEERWYDSAKVMKKRCFDEIVNRHFWTMFSSELSTYQNDTVLVNHAKKALIEELKNIVDMDSLQMLYRIIDNNKSIPTTLFTEATEYYEDRILTNYEWESFKGIKGQKLYFVRAVVDNWKGENEGNKIQAKSNKTKNGWTKNNVIYRNICYDSTGIYSLQPRIFQSGYYRTKEYFAKSGTLRFVSKDTLIVNYGGSIRSGNRVWFVRRDKLNSEPEV